MEDKRSRAWVVTINNYTDEQYEDVKEYISKTEYGIVGKEIGEQNGTPHLQIYFRLKNATTFKALKKRFPTAHIAAAKGNDEQNNKYCSKESEYYEHGTISQQGKRTDLDEIRDIIKTTGRMSDVVMVATSYQSVKMAEQILKYHEPKRDFKPYVRWYWGAIGTGKTKNAIEIFGDEPYYTTMETAKWWDGYDAHKCLLIDDMRKNFTTFNNLLRILDRYAFSIETKGGTRQLLANHIIITSCYPPTEMFDTREDIQQLIRRIDEIKEFNAETS